MEECRGQALDSVPLPVHLTRAREWTLKLAADDCQSPYPINCALLFPGSPLADKSTVPLHPHMQRRILSRSSSLPSPHKSSSYSGHPLASCSCSHQTVALTAPQTWSPKASCCSPQPGSPGPQHMTRDSLSPVQSCSSWLSSLSPHWLGESP